MICSLTNGEASETTCHVINEYLRAMRTLRIKEEVPEAGSVAGSIDDTKKAMTIFVCVNSEGGCVRKFPYAACGEDAKAVPLSAAACALKARGQGIDREVYPARHDWKGFSELCKAIASSTCWTTADSKSACNVELREWGVSS